MTVMSNAERKARYRQGERGQQTIAAYREQANERRRSIRRNRALVEHELAKGHRVAQIMQAHGFDYGYVKGIRDEIA